MGMLDRFTHQDIEAIRIGKLNQGINTSFVIYRLAGTIFDAGPSNQWPVVRQFLDEQPVKELLLTHHHADHAGNSGLIAKHYDITPFAPSLALGKLNKGFSPALLARFLWGSVPPVKAKVLEDQFQLSNGDSINSIYAPGHTEDMTCFLLRDRGILLSADLYIANRQKYLHQHEDLGLILTSMRNILKQDFDTILCPHRGVVNDGKLRLQEKYDYLMELTIQSHNFRRQGLNNREITRKLLGREDVPSLLSGFDFSKINLINACMEITSQQLELHQQ